jgi:U3 small nucleolar RNA-associated protein 10
MVSPYLLVKPAVKTLEWLIFKFRINEKFATNLFACILPYHDTAIFGKILGLLVLPTGWSSLKKISNGSPVSRNTIVDAVLGNKALFLFIVSEVSYVA